MTLNNQQQDTVTVKYSNTHCYVSVPCKIKPKHCTAKAKLFGARIYATWNAGMATAVYMHKDNAGRSRLNGIDITASLEVWLSNWGYAGISLADYLNRLFGDKDGLR